MPQPSHPLSLLSIFPETAEAKILYLLVQLGVEMVQADEGSILVLDEAAQELIFAMTVGNRESEERLRGQRVPVGQGIAGLAAITRQTQTGAPVFDKIEQWPGRGASSEPSAVLAAPMLVADNVVGVITAVRFATDARFKAKEVELYSRFAALAGAFVEMRRRLNRLEAVPSVNEQTPMTEQQAMEDQIIASVRRLVQTRPDALTSIATLLRAVEDVAAGR
jgi:GAF domain-containing protein